MSIHLKISNLTDKQLKKISLDLCVEKEPSKYAYSQKPEYVVLYENEDDDLYVPFAYGAEHGRPDRSCFSNMTKKFKGELRDEQKIVKKEAIDSLNSTGYVMISCYPGFGKTCSAIYLACKIGLKTLILCHRIVLVNQWRDALKLFCPEAKIEVVSGKGEIKNADFYIINASNVPKKGREAFSDIGLLIVDEAHLIMAENLSKAMRYITPRYVIGLTATPYRNDGLNVLLDMYFGQHKIIRKLFRKHFVYKVETGFKPEVKTNKMGKVDWGSVIDSQCNNEWRNNLIVDIVKYFSDRVFLILTKRVSQANMIIEKLKEIGEDVTSLVGKIQTYNLSSRILVGTVGKCSTGFDHPKLNAMILASDVEQYFVQYLGRVFRTQDTIPFIFDIVDNYSLLTKHFKTRNGVYLEHGGIVKNFRIDFPDFVFQKI
jgi:uncharacterized protein YlbG (UPF0298 family)